MPIPGNWTVTKAPPDVVDGYSFLAYRTGIMRYARYCADLDAIVYAHPTLEGYTVKIGNEWIKSPRTGKTHKFRSRFTAYRAAVKAKVTT